MAIDRSKFKATSVAAVQQQDKEISSLVGQKSGRAGYLKIYPGKNMFRIFPPHPDAGGTSFMEPKSTVWLPMMIESKDDKGTIMKDERGNPIMKEGNKSAFNSRIHGNTAKDLVEQYFELGNAWADKHKFHPTDSKIDSDLRKKYKDKLWGNFATKVQGIRYRHNWVFYGKDLIGKQGMGFVEVGTAVKDGMNKIINIEASNQPLSTEATDPFTDLTEGRALIVMYDDKATKAADYYSTSIDTATEPAEINGRKVNIQKTYPLADDDLEALLALPSLYKNFRNCFRRRDFELQYQGLAFFDQKHAMGIFEMPEWEAIVDEISAYYPTDTQEESHEDEGGETSEETAEETSAAKESDQFDLMSRDELKEFNLKNKCGILIKPNMEEDAIRERLREWIEFTSTSEGAEESNSQSEPEVEAPSATIEEKKEEAVTEESPAQRKLREMREKSRKA